MKGLLGLLVIVGMCSLPALAAGDGVDCPYSKKIERSRCCQHPCPVAQTATKDGYQMVAQLPMAVVSLSELEI